MLLDITITSLQEGRPLFDNILYEPLFYRKHFRQWVLEGLEEAAKLNPPEELATS